MTKGRSAQAAQRVAVVTGASSGIGLAIARAFHGEGFSVAALARREAELRARLPDDCLAVACDVSDPDAVREAIEKTVEGFARIDVLVNCAGVIRRSLSGAASEDEIALQVQVNLLGTMRMCQATLPELRKHGGAIVNIGSTLAKQPVPGVSVYAATKGAIEAYTRALAVEEGPNGVRVNTICPALIRSDIWTNAGLSSEDYEALVAARAAEYPLGRVGEPEDVAALALFLCSGGADWLSGACIPLDGASSINHVKR